MCSSMWTDLSDDVERGSVEEAAEPDDVTALRRRPQPRRQLVGRVVEHAHETVQKPVKHKTVQKPVKHKTVQKPVKT